MNYFSPRISPKRFTPPGITLDVLIGIVAAFDLLALLGYALVISERL